MFMIASLALTGLGVVSILIILGGAAVSEPLTNVLDAASAVEARPDSELPRA
jgi:hypothetical protein